jgi:hypothetical protein
MRRAGSHWFAGCVVMAMPIAMTSCGGGSGGAPPPPPPVVNASPGGIWNGTDPNYGSQIYGLVSETGTFFLSASDGVTYVGVFVTQGNGINGDMVAILPPGGIFPDRATSGTGTIGGKIVERMSISGGILVNTDPATSIVGGQVFSSQLLLTFSAAYNRSSSLATVAGSFTFGTGMLSVTGGGVVFGQDASGCVVNGTVSTIDTRYNMYDASLTFTGCTGTPDGAVLTGLATLDDSQSPELLVFGVSDDAAGARFAMLMRQARM